jgi:hypothetical protein
MSQITTRQVHRVQQVSRYARASCSLLMLVLVASCLQVAYAIITASGPGGPGFYVGSHIVAAARFDVPQVKAWLLVLVTMGGFLSIAIVYLLRRLFGNLARGEIFCAGNVENIRRLGHVFLGIGVMQLLIPLAHDLSRVPGLLESGRVTIQPATNAYMAVAPFAVAGIIYLVSWIMRVGLGVSEEANELRRDAELVV